MGGHAPTGLTPCPHPTHYRPNCPGAVSTTPVLPRVESSKCLPVGAVRRFPSFPSCSLTILCQDRVVQHSFSASILNLGPCWTRRRLPVRWRRCQLRAFSHQNTGHHRLANPRLAALVPKILKSNSNVPVIGARGRRRCRLGARRR